MNYEQNTYITGSANAKVLERPTYEDPKSPHRAIPQAFSNLEKDLYALGELANELNNRLKPVSRGESPCTAPVTGVEASDIPMVNAIAKADEMLCSALNQLRDIVGRLEV